MMQRKWMLTTLGAGAAVALAVPEVRYLRRLGEISQRIREVQPPREPNAADDGPGPLAPG
jgi:hypothetical protein